MKLLNDQGKIKVKSVKDQGKIRERSKERSGKDQGEIREMPKERGKDQWKARKDRRKITAVMFGFWFYSYSEHVSNFRYCFPFEYDQCLLCDTWGLERSVIMLVFNLT